MTLEGESVDTTGAETTTSTETTSTETASTSTGQENSLLTGDTTSQEVAKAHDQTTAFDSGVDGMKLGEFDVEKFPKKFVDDNGTYDVQKLIDAHRELETRFSAPESYSVDKVFEDTGMAWQSETQQSEVTELFQKHKITQEAADELLRYYGKSLEGVVGQYGTPVDTGQEQNKLETAWGQDFIRNQDEASAYARSLPEEVIRYPLYQTALGMQLLHDLAKQKSGPRPLESHVKMEPEDIKAQLSEIMSDPEYWKVTDKGKQLQERADRLNSKLAVK